MSPDNELIGVIYEAAMGRHLWETVLAGVAERVHAPSGGFAVVSTDLETMPVDARLRLRDDIMAVYERDYIANPWTQTALCAQGVTAARTSSLFPVSAMRRTAFYADIVRPLGNLLYGVGGIFHVSPTTMAFISLYRDERAGDFEDDELARYRQFAGHIQRSTELFARLSHLGELRTAAMEGLHVLRQAIILVDSRGQVLHVNAAAERILAKRDGLSVYRGELQASSPSETAALRRLVCEAAATGSGAETAALGGTHVLRRVSSRPLTLLVSPLRSPQLGVGPERAAAAIFLNDGDDDDLAPEMLLRRLFGLTAAEARLARVLVTGEGLASAADRLGIARNTAKAQSRRIYEKLGVRRQSELVRVIGDVTSGFKRS